ncbi:MAG: glycosyltransferase family 4 protein [Campylobacter sp.]|nr:glycosyltransferase family 4 protein [Campylobacter sp.]
MAKFGFLSHSDMSIYFFRAPIMRELKKRGHEVYAIAPKGKYTPNLEKEFISVNYDLDKASLNPFKVSQNTANLTKVLKELNLDFLQTSAHKSNVFGTIAAKNAGIRTVINLIEGLGSFYVDNDLKSRAVRFVMEKLYKKSFALANGCIFVNHSDPRYMVDKNLITIDKVFCIKSVGVDSKLFDEEKYLDAKMSHKKVVLMIGRALWHKGIREFYEAADILSNRDDVQFVFAGDTFEGNKSSASKEFLKNPNVLWLGWCEDVFSLYKSAYMIVLPSYKEGFPRTILEAMSMSRPCVVSNADGCVEAVEDGHTGLICQMKSSADLAKKIKILLDDENLARKMGYYGRKAVLEKYDEPIITQKYLDIYRQFLYV